MPKPRKRPQRSPGVSPWYDVPDMMRLFDCSERTVWKWVSMQRLPEPVRQGTRWTRWPKEEVDELLKAWGKDRR